MFHFVIDTIEIGCEFFCQQFCLFMCQLIIHFIECFLSFGITFLSVFFFLIYLDFSLYSWLYCVRHSVQIHHLYSADLSVSRAVSWSFFLGNIVVLRILNIGINLKSIYPRGIAFRSIIIRLT